jgi:hypothetical protein
MMAPHRTSNRLTPSRCSGSFEPFEPTKSAIPKQPTGQLEHSRVVRVTLAAADRQPTVTRCLLLTTTARAPPRTRLGRPSGVRPQLLLAALGGGPLGHNRLEFSSGPSRGHRPRAAAPRGRSSSPTRPFSVSGSPRSIGSLPLSSPNRFVLGMPATGRPFPSTGPNPSHASTDTAEILPAGKEGLPQGGERPVH